MPQFKTPEEIMDAILSEKLLTVEGQVWLFRYLEDKPIKTESYLKFVGRSDGHRLAWLQLETKEAKPDISQYLAPQESLHKPNQSGALVVSITRSRPQERPSILPSVHLIADRYKTESEEKRQESIRPLSLARKDLPDESSGPTSESRRKSVHPPGPKRKTIAAPSMMAESKKARLTETGRLEL